MENIINVIVSLIPVLVFVFALFAVFLYSYFENKRNRERRNTIKNYANTNGLKYVDRIFGFPSDCDFKMAHDGSNQSSQGILIGERNGIKFATFDFSYVTGSGKSRQEHTTTVCLLSGDDRDFPDFFIRKENAFLDTLGKLFGGQDINFTEDSEFSKMFVLQGSSEPLVRNYFDSRIRKAFVHHFKNNNVYEAHGDTLAIRTSGYMDLQGRLNFLNSCVGLFNDIKPSSSNFLS